MSRKYTLAITCLLSSVAHAGPVSFSFSGTIGQVLQAPPAPFAGVQAGDPFQVDYTLDVDKPDLDSLENLGTFSGSVIDYVVTIDGASASTDLGGVNTVNAHALAPQDVYAAIGLFEDFTTSMSFKDATGTALDPQDNLATIDLSGFSDRSFLLLAGQFPAVIGTISPQIPEPGGFTGLLIGLAAVLSMARSASRK